ncbi:ABC transporter substrate-binding protein [Kibdelosporangium philippinense]|uniref:ABC transporter substrate-binding protein n=1 Tax=Kibdelosporangium philippinense TaxID=211113 RepID=A0ABS8ZX11_9PSEU|nr:ABC transporter substrate-binding protein [Kibdelosporangium philippinense]MCE7010422.1 ABC transporter substrate-binding protein [Kibdelosporangium philippinense]
MRLAALGIVTALLASLTGCGLLGGSSDTNAGPTDKVEKSTIRLGLLPVVDVASVHLAIQEGYFQQEGLDVKLINIQGAGAAIPNLVSDKSDFDIVFGNYLSFFNSQAKGIAQNVEGLKFVADGYVAKPNTWMVLAGPNSPAKKITDLPDKKIAVTTKQSLAEVSIRSALKVNDVDADRVTFVEMPYTDMGAALAANRVDAALLAEPFITQAGKDYGAVQLFDAATGPTADLPIAGYGTTGRFARENPKTIAAFQRAFAKGQEAAGADRSKVEKLLPGYAKIDPQTAALVNLGGFPTRLDANRLQRIPDLMLEFGMLQQRIDANTMILAG